MQQVKSLLFLCFPILVASTAFSQQVKQTQAIKADQQRLENLIVQLSKFGKDTAGRGYRVAYSAGYVAARSWMIEQMKEAGLDVSMDYAGNIIGKRKGKNAGLKPIAFGSHIDMVPDGGNYDGCVGAIGGLEVMQVLQEKNITTNHPLLLIITTDEEGTMVGSQSLSGNFSLDELNTVSYSGLTVREGLKIIGGNPDSIKSVAFKKGDLKAFIELHIEQGGILEKENIQVGIVEGIVGIADWDITVEGFANHAGTTPMNLRQDALLAAAKVIIAVNEVINGSSGSQVGGVGKISVHPGAYNVVPGKVVLGMEIRDLSANKIKELFEQVEKKTAAIAAQSGVRITIRSRPPDAVPALTDVNLQKKIEQSATALGLSVKYMQSGAGHDAQNMALIAPIGMIFVPSAGGISHSPKEFTTAEDMANGTNVLLQTVLALDKE